MKRLPLWYFVAAILLSASLSSAEWPTFRHDNLRTGYIEGASNYSLSDIEVIWNYTTGDAIYSSPAISDLDGDGFHDIVVGSDDGNFYALNWEGDLMWDYNVGVRIRSHPTVCDLDVDGNPEILFGADDGILYALNSDGVMLWKFKTGGPILSSVACEDMEGKPELEVMFGSSDGKFYALDYTGKKLWDYATLEPIESSPAIGDINGDGELDIVFGGGDNLMYVLSFPPYKVWQYQAGGAIVGAPAISDVDADGTVDIVVVSSAGLVSLIYYGSASRVQLFTLGNEYFDYLKNGTADIELVMIFRENGQRARSDSTLSNISQNAEEDVWKLSSGSKEYILEVEDITDKHSPIKVSGERAKRTVCEYSGFERVCHEETVGYTKFFSKWNYTELGATFSSPAVADVDGDGYSDVVVGSNDRILHIINYTGEKMVYYTTGKAVQSSPAIADLDGDGLNEILFGSNNKLFYVLNYPGLAKWFYRTGGAITSSPAVADLAGDGTFEIVVGSADGVLYVFGDKGSILSGKADGFYREAEMHYLDGDLVQVREYVEKGQSLCDEVYDDQCRSKGDKILKRLEADRHLLSAEIFYNISDLKKASEHVDKASTIYKAINYIPGAERLSLFLDLWDADVNYQKAQAFYDSLDFQNASDYAEKAGDLYEKVGLDGEVAKVDALLIKSSLHMQADELYVKALNLYYSGGFLENVSSLVSEAHGMYTTINSVLGINVTTDLLDQITAEKNILASASYLNKSDYHNARSHALNASRIFDRLNHTAGIGESTRLLNVSSMYVDAGKLYSAAEDLYHLRRYGEAVEYASSARDIYRILGDGEWLLYSDSLVNSSVDAMKRVPDRSFTGRVVALVTVILLIVVSALWVRVSGQRRAKRKSKIIP